MRRSLLPLFLVVFVLAAAPSRAQLIMRSHAPKGTPPPRALIVVLPTGQSRIGALLDMGDTVRAGEVRRDLEGVREKIVLDFNENFTYCPYYFVADSNIDRLKYREYAGVVLDGSLQPVQAPAIDSSDKTLLIARYGYRERDPGTRQTTLAGGSFETQFNGDTEAMLQQLVLSDGSFQQLVRPFPRTVGGAVPREAIRRPRYEYRYQSKHYDIQYRASASAASLQLERFYGPSDYVRP